MSFRMNELENKEKTSTEVQTNESIKNVFEGRYL